jgi:cold shock CspA family protein
MPLGTVTYFSSKAGYGFVKLDNGESCFISYSEIQENDQSIMLKVGQAVELLKTANKNGLKVYKIVRP